MQLIEGVNHTCVLCRAAMMEGTGSLENQLEATKVCFSVIIKPASSTETTRRFPSLLVYNSVSESGKELVAQLAAQRLVCETECCFCLCSASLPRCVHNVAS